MDYPTKTFGDGATFYTNARAVIVEGTTEVRHIDTGLVDEKGRKIGFRFSSYQMEVVYEGEREYGSLHQEKPGTKWFYARFIATRNGEVFGSSDSYSRADTREEAVALAEKALAKAIKRYEKKYGR